MGSDIEQGTTTRDGERVGYYQWDPPNGKKYTYELNNDNDRQEAKERAEEQRRAAAADTFE